jgi:hypothetical protein
MALIEIQVEIDGWQFFLQPHRVVRVWRVGSMELVAEIPVPLLVSIVSQHLFQAALVTELQTATRKPLSTAAPRGRTPPIGPPSAPQRALLRAARKTRRPS